MGSGTRPYALTDHIHEREAGYHLDQLLHPSPESNPSDAFVPSTSPQDAQRKKFQLAFVPNVGSWFSGIISVLSAPLAAPATAKEIKELYKQKYEGEKLIEVKSDIPTLQDIQGIQGWKVGGVQVHSGGRRVVVVVGVCFIFLYYRLTILDRVAWTIYSKVLRRSACR